MLWPQSGLLEGACHEAVQGHPLKGGEIGSLYLGTERPKQHETKDQGLGILGKNLQEAEVAEERSGAKKIRMHPKQELMHALECPITLVSPSQPSAAYCVLYKIQ